MLPFAFPDSRIKAKSKGSPDGILEILRNLMLSFSFLPSLRIWNRKIWNSRDILSSETPNSMEYQSLGPGYFLRCVIECFVSEQRIHPRGLRLETRLPMTPFPNIQRTSS